MKLYSKAILNWVAFFIILVMTCMPAFAQVSASGNGQNPGSVHFGGFCREGGSSPYAMGSQSAGTASPSPYPSFSGNLSTYLYGQDGSGHSIESANPLDQTKLNNLVETGAKWCRNTDAPYYIDNSHVSAGSYTWGQLDAILGALKLHNIDPVIGTETGGVNYADPLGTEPHDTYDSAADFTGYCSGLATHVNTVFGYHKYSIIGNEGNGLAGVAAGYGILNGSPVAPVLSLSTGGSLALTARNYRITAIIGGVETLAGPEYYVNITPTSGHQTVILNWGAFPGETDGYNIYAGSAGNEHFLATVSHGTTSYSDTGNISPSGAMPVSSVVTVAGMEGQVAAYMTGCYSAIKAADPTAFVFGLELNITNGLTPTPKKFVQDLLALGCGPGTCYDGIALHLYPGYPFPSNSTACKAETGTGDFGTSCIDAIESALTSPVPIMISEYGVSVGSAGTVTTEANAQAAVLAGLQALSTYPNVAYIAFSNIDECGDAAYSSSSNFFYNGCLIGGPTGGNNLKQLRWQSAHTVFTTSTGAVGNGAAGQ